MKTSNIKEEKIKAPSTTIQKTGGQVPANMKPVTVNATKGGSTPASMGNGKISANGGLPAAGMNGSPTMGTVVNGQIQNQGNNNNNPYSYLLQNNYNQQSQYGTPQIGHMNTVEIGPDGSQVINGVQQNNGGGNNGNGGGSYNINYSSNYNVTDNANGVNRPDWNYQQSQQVQNAYNALMAQLGNRPGEYTPSETVQQALATLQELQSNKPDAYQSQYGEQIQSLLNQILNPGQFHYEFNGDELFKQYADMYTQQGKQASLDAMGQAAGLTGGYGNSYGQMVGNQAYDQYLTQLYDRGMDLRDRAYQQYQDEIANRYNQFNTLQSADQNDYQHWLDNMNNYYNDLNYYTNWYTGQQNFDYGQYQDNMQNYYNDLNFYNNFYNNQANMDYQQYADQMNFQQGQYEYEQNLQNTIHQFEASLNWEQMNAAQTQAAQYALAILQNGQMPTAELLEQAGLSEEDAKKLMAQISSGGHGGGGGSGQTYYTFNGHYYVLKNGRYEEVDPSSVPANAHVNTDHGADIAIQGAADWTNDAVNQVGNFINGLFNNNNNNNQQQQQQTEEDKKKKPKQTGYQE